MSAAQFARDDLLLATGTGRTLNDSASTPLVSVRSAGTSPNARRKVSLEEKHKSRLVAEFTGVVSRLK